MAHVVHRADDLPVAQRDHQRQLRIDRDAAGRATEPHFSEMEYPLAAKVANLLAQDPESFDLATPEIPQFACTLVATIKATTELSLDRPEILNLRVLEGEPRS